MDQLVLHLLGISVHAQARVSHNLKLLHDFPLAQPDHVNTMAMAILI